MSTWPEGEMYLALVSLAYDLRRRNLQYSSAIELIHSLLIPENKGAVMARETSVLWAMTLLTARNRRWRDVGRAGRFSSARAGWTMKYQSPWYLLLRMGSWLRSRGRTTVRTTGVLLL